MKREQDPVSPHSDLAAIIQTVATHSARLLTGAARPLAAILLGVLLAGCSGSVPSHPNKATTGRATTSGSTSAPSAAASQNGHHRPRSLPAPFRHPIPGMPAPPPGGVYAAAAGPSMIRASVRHDPQLIYVPDSESNGHTTVISQRSHRILRVLHTGGLDQHVTPSWDLRTLYVEASESNHLAKINPATGRMTGTVRTNRPYNLYFTPNGRQAIVMDEQHNEVVFADPRSFRREQVIRNHGCRGPNHADFSANGRYFIVSCEFSATLIKVSTLEHRVIGLIHLPKQAIPQDVRLAPKGYSFFVADMGRDLLLNIDWQRFKVAHSYPTLMMPHGIYFSRNQKALYLSDRRSGAVQVFNLARHRFTQTWRIPGGGSPDMGGLSADGDTLWLSGRYDGVVYGFDTRSGKLIAKIKVPGNNPHGLLVWPQPGRYSLGHTGLMR
jgi:DNA-binding beta-propeller fold protein YncE